MRMTPHMIQNVCDGLLNMKDLILEHAIGSIFMLIKMTFTDFRMDKNNTILMILKYDKFNNNMFWEDTKGGQHDITKVNIAEPISMIREKMENAAEIYLFECQMSAVTKSQTKAFRPARHEKGYVYPKEVVQGDYNNTARHIYNIANNPQYNMWTDPTTCKKDDCNIEGWHYTLELAVDEIDEDWFENNNHSSD